uniref:Dishevelled segment polarity protein 1a n=1 Tax=Callorhinchus milii TaxID=7868 RepID=A0A4W3HBW6_CALMI
DRVVASHYLEGHSSLKQTLAFYGIRSLRESFQVVKEEISDDNARLPCFNGRVVSWLVLAESCTSDAGSQCAESQLDLPPIERTGGIGHSRPPSFHANTTGSRDGLDNETATESILSIRRDRHRRRIREREVHQDGVPRINGHTKAERQRDPGGYESASTVMSSELDSSSFIDSDDDDNTSRLSNSTEQSVSSRLMRRHKRRRRKHKMQQMDRVRRRKYNFLGISIVGQSNDRGDGGIYIGSIMKGGAVAADGRIEPGDMLLQVNDVNFENMSNDDAVRILREIVSKPGPISLTVAKCWDPTPRSYFTIPRTEPVRPIDPAAWISHTTAMTGGFPRYGMSPTLSAITSTSSSLTSSIPDSEKYDDCRLTVKSDLSNMITVKTDMASIVKAMQSCDSGLEIRDRMWLKITISSAVIGADVVDWLFSRVQGFKDRREARKYASSMLKHGYLRHTVNKITFSEQCYYIFGDLCTNLAAMKLHEVSSGTSDRDMLAPLPHPASPWPLGQGFPCQYPLPHPYYPTACQEPSFNYGNGSAGSQPSEGSKSSGSNRSNSERRAGSGKEKERKADSKSAGSGSESDNNTRNSVRCERPPSQLSHRSPSERSHHSHLSHGAPGVPPLYNLTKTGPKVLAPSAPPGAPPGRDLASVPPELTGSRQSFQKAMGNPCEFFIDIM